jgi:hypothetical protein
LWPWLTGRGEVPAVTSYNITSLSPGTSYIFRIYSLVQGVENNYVEVVYRTLAQDAGAGTLPPGRTLRACACACASPLSLSLCVCVPHTTPLLCMDTHTHTLSLSVRVFVLLDPHMHAWVRRCRDWCVDGLNWRRHCWRGHPVCACDRGIHAQQAGPREEAKEASRRVQLAAADGASPIVVHSLTHSFTHARTCSHTHSTHSRAHSLTYLYALYSRTHTLFP